MSEHHRGRKQGVKRGAQTASQRRVTTRLAVVVAAGAAAALAFWLFHGSRTGPAGPGFEKLKGRWLRPDGGYILEIKDVATNGKLEAAYLNPRPIHISKAEATQQESTTKVFIELHDIGYPGSTYTLTYDGQRDELQGVYYQAATQQSFDVVFVRMK